MKPGLNVSTGSPGPVSIGGTPRVPRFINPMRSEPDERFSRTIDQIPADLGSGGGGGFDGKWPLKFIKVDSTHIKVTLGTISGFTPTDVDTDIDVSGTDGTWWFYFHVTISGKSVTAAELLSNIGGPVPSDDGNNSYRLVGKVVVAGGVITSVTNAFGWSQSVVTCVDDTEPHIWETGA